MQPLTSNSQPRCAGRGTVILNHALLVGAYALLPSANV